VFVSRSLAAGGLLPTYFLYASIQSEAIYLALGGLQIQLAVAHELVEFRSDRLRGRMLQLAKPAPIRSIHLRPTVARPIVVRPTMMTPLRSKCSSHWSWRG